MLCSSTVIAFSPPVQPCKTRSFLNFQADNRASRGEHGSGSILPSFAANGKPAQGEDQPGGDEWEGSRVTQREKLCEGREVVRKTSPEIVSRKVQQQQSRKEK